MHNLTKPRHRVTAGIVLSASYFAAIGCSGTKDKSAPGPSDTTPKQTVKIAEGTAGGVIEETYQDKATVRAIDLASRKVTLETEGGKTSAFTASPEVRNLEQVKVGDTVEASFTRQYTIFVKEGGTPGKTHTSSLSRAPVGASPRATFAETFEVVGVVDEIDSINRTAMLRFPDGERHRIPVRSDVDLTKYKVGDNVVIRVTQRLTVLVAKP